MKPPRYEQAARTADDAIRRLRKIAPSYERLKRVDAAVADLKDAVECLELEID